MKDWQVLVVEDDADSAEVISRILTFHGVRHGIARNADEAMTMISSEHPDLILVDLGLPDISGWDLLQTLRSTPSTAEVPVVTITAYGNDSLAEEALAAGFDAFFTKPVAAFTFVAELERIMEGSR